MSKNKSKKNHSKKNNQTELEMASEEKMETASFETETNDTPSRSPISRIFFAISIIVLIAAAAYFAIQKWGNVLVVASVNGTPISKIQLWQRLEKRQGQAVLDEMVNEILIEQEAAKKNISVTDKEIKAKIKELETRFKGAKNLDQTLSMQGMTRDDLTRQIRFQALVEKMIPQSKISDKEIQAEYDKNPETYGGELTSEVKSQIKNQLLQQKTSQAFSTWFEKLKKSAKISKTL